jgi:hypothetical protein
MTLLTSLLTLPTPSNVGTAGTNVVANEKGDSYTHTTILTLSSVAITIGDNASLSMGALIYTLPAGACVINSTYLSVGLTLAGTPTTDTPEIGLGTVIGSGANATLGAVGATSENIIEGAAMANIAGTAKVIQDIPTANEPLFIAAGGAHTIYLNFADAWNDVNATAATASGTIVINWNFLA